MKILVTGGAGYIGTSLIPQLLARSRTKVRVLDNLMFGGDQLLPFIRNPHFEFIRGDIRDGDVVRDAALGVDVIIHLAAIVGFPACRAQPQLAKSVNIDGTKNIARTAGQRLVFYGSTGSNYGAVEDVCTEETPLNPLSLYAQTKTIAEQILLDKCSTVAFRFATAFGASGRTRLDLMINDFTYRAATQGYLVVYEADFMRTFIHVSDIARAFLHVIQRYEYGISDYALLDAASHRAVYNVGSDEMNFSKRQICEMICEQVPNCYVHYAEVGSDADKRNYQVSYSKFQALGYRATITVEDGITELLKAFPLLAPKNPYSNA